MMNMAIGRTLWMKRYWSSGLFRVARTEYESTSTRDEDGAWLKDTHSPLVCLVFSCISLEAFLNELADDILHPRELEAVHARPVFRRTKACYLKERNRPPRKFIPRSAWNFSVLRRGLRARPFEDDEQPFIDTCRLFRLRNWLAHNEPFKLGEELRGPYPAAITDLDNIGLLTKTEGKVMAPEILISNRRIMRWELNTVSAMVRYLAGCVPDGPVWKFNFDSLNDKWPVYPDKSTQKAP
jgi:hypothetical protein